MDGHEVVTKRGVYKDLSQSPYEWKSPYGDIFKFPSAKKLEIYTRDVWKERARLIKTLDKTGLDKYLPPEVVDTLDRSLFRSYYEHLLRK